MTSSWTLCLGVQVGVDESREQLIKTHYMARVGELTTQLQISDSKAVHFHSEVTPHPRTHALVLKSIIQALFLVLSLVYLRSMISNGVARTLLSRCNKSLVRKQLHYHHVGVSEQFKTV